ncbi:MAG: tetratricopeptide repeat protein [Gammaproteobacteria bacterium]|nr:tetratricopeptide repeat protein [Gammaproteobacteria bacterium]
MADLALSYTVWPVFVSFFGEEPAIALKIFKTIYAEIRRREVLRVSAVYAVGAWLVLQVAEVITEPLGLPDWIMPALIIAAVVGFPVVFFLAWVIRIEPEGLIFDLPLWQGDSGNPVEQKTDFVVVAAVTSLLVIGGYAVGARIFRDIPTTRPMLASAEAPPNSIAVLAFENFGLPGSEHFASGLAAEILNMLASLRELNVAARTSSFQFRDKQIGIREIAQNLSVRYVLEGNVSQAGDEIKVTAQLINGSDGYREWGKTYDRRLEDIFDIQEEIAAGVVNELKIALSVDSEERLQKKPTENIDAYVFYLQGRERLYSPPDIDVLAAASELFRNALEIDPKFSRAHAGVCEAHLSLYELSNDVTHFDQAESACEKAAKLDPELSSEIHIALGVLYRNRGWYDRAENELDQAIALAPSAVDAYIELGQIHLAEGDDEAAEATFLRAVDLKKHYWRANNVLGNFYYRTKRYSEAIRYFEVAHRLTPGSASNFSDLGAAYWMHGDAEKARVAWDRALELKPTRLGYTNKGLVYYYAGQFADAVDMQLKALEIAPDDHRLWGRLAESYRFVPGKEAESQEAYVKAAGLAETKLNINAKDWVTMGLLGLYYAHLNQIDRALRLAGKSVEISQRNPEALYYLALTRLKGGDQTGAIDLLAEAVALDEQYRQFIVSDPDLQPIKDERFAQLLEP